MKKWIALAMALSMLLILSACGGAASSSAPASSQPADSSEPVVSSEPAVSSEPVVSSTPAFPESVSEPASAAAPNIWKPDSATTVGGMLAGTWVLHGVGMGGVVLTMEQLEAILASQSDEETATLMEEMESFSGLQFVFNEDGTGVMSVTGQEAAGMVDDFAWEDMGDATNFTINTVSGESIDFTYDAEEDLISIEVPGAQVVLARA